MSKHTPGPWIINPRAVTSVQDANERGIAACGGFFSSLPDRAMGDCEQEANARLIAAAPQLLEALMMALDDSEVMAPDGKPLCVGPDTLTRMRAAIAAATGEA